jgi:NAD-dependent dihydropyrimidine dehydrogenase PreA subunit
VATSSIALNQITTQKIVVDAKKCIGCGACVKVCPFMVYGLSVVEKKKKAVPVYEEDCFLCQSCQAQCPTDAIAIAW